MEGKVLLRVLEKSRPSWYPPAQKAALEHLGVKKHSSDRLPVTGKTLEW